jgi:hypothetical protein
MIVRRFNASDNSLKADKSDGSTADSDGNADAASRYFVATGFTGEPVAPVKGWGEASNRKV